MGEGRQSIREAGQNAEMEPGRGVKPWYCLISIFSYNRKEEFETERSAFVI